MKPLLFGDKRKGHDAEAYRRLRTVKVAAMSGATTHEELCDALSEELRGEFAELAVLPQFTCLADSGMRVMDAIFASLENAANPSGLTVRDLAKRPDIRVHCAGLRHAADRWFRRPHPHVQIRHLESADKFAVSVRTRSAEDCLRNLVTYHERDGGGVRWFLLRDGRVVPNAPIRPGVAARYRFRLWSLCRMAAQCRQIRSMPKALQFDRRPEPGLLEDEGV